MTRSVEYRSPREKKRRVIHLILDMTLLFKDHTHHFHRFIFEDYTPTNFDTFPAAIMTVFQVCSVLCSQNVILSV